MSRSRLVPLVLALAARSACRITLDDPVDFSSRSCMRRDGRRSASTPRSTPTSTWIEEQRCSPTARSRAATTARRPTRAAIDLAARQEPRPARRRRLPVRERPDAHRRGQARRPRRPRQELPAGHGARADARSARSAADPPPTAIGFMPQNAEVRSPAARSDALTRRSRSAGSCRPAPSCARSAHWARSDRGRSTRAVSQRSASVISKIGPGGLLDAVLGGLATTFASSVRGLRSARRQWMIDELAK